MVVGVPQILSVYYLNGEGVVSFRADSLARLLDCIGSTANRKESLQ